MSHDLFVPNGGPAPRKLSPFNLRADEYFNYQIEYHPEGGDPRTAFVLAKNAVTAIAEFVGNSPAVIVDMIFPALESPGHPMKVRAHSFSAGGFALVYQVVYEDSASDIRMCFVLADSVHMAIQEAILGKGVTDKAVHSVQLNLVGGDPMRAWAPASQKTVAQ